MDRLYLSGTSNPWQPHINPRSDTRKLIYHGPTTIKEYLQLLLTYPIIFIYTFYWYPYYILLH